MPRSKAFSTYLDHPHPQEQCLLFTLPIEIRTIIYEFSLYVPRSGSDAIRLIRPLRRGSDQVPSVLSLLATCRQIHNEAVTIFYRQHTLSIPAAGLAKRDVYGIGNFVNITSPLRLATIKKIGCLVNGLQEATLACRAIHRLPNLIDLRFHQRANRDPYHAYTFSRDAQFLKDAVGKLRSVEVIVFHRGLTPWTEFYKDDSDLVRLQQDLVASLPKNVAKSGGNRVVKVIEMREFFGCSGQCNSW